MDTEEVASTAGVVACLILLAAVVVPYGVLTAPAHRIGEYYASGPVGANVLAFLALVGAVVFLAGRNGRTEPDLAAGIALVLGLSAFGLATLWALSVEQAVIFSFPAADAWIESHRWVTVAASAFVALAAVVYSRAALSA
ncbi:DUF7548 family protein [Halegenticoccus tardaugens]|uniref:DUF7548 family protein n=1 Tax=Halegenticoccus tardaugens TaxID=2071624 RepID=UPI00100A25E9|nr:hypothetical protein [Halegenticoccus tardaugens]